MSEQPLCMHGKPHRYSPADDAPPSLDAVVAKARENLREKYQLVYASYDDVFTSKQVSVLLSGENEWESDEFTHLEEWESDARRLGVVEVFNDLLDDDERAVIEYTDAYEEIAEEITERDESDWFNQMLRNTGSMLMRYDLDVEVPAVGFGDDAEYTDAEDTILGQLTDNPSDELRKAVRTLLTEQAHYGGRLQIIFYGDVEDWYRLTQRARNGETLELQLNEFSLLAHDGWNGSGADEKVSNSMLTVPFDPERLSTDENGQGYSWTSIAGPVASAYTIDYTVNTRA